MSPCAPHQTARELIHPCFQLSFQAGDNCCPGWPRMSQGEWRRRHRGQFEWPAHESVSYCPILICQICLVLERISTDVPQQLSIEGSPMSFLSSFLKVALPVARADDAVEEVSGGIPGVHATPSHSKIYHATTMQAPAPPEPIKSRKLKVSAAIQHMLPRFIDLYIICYRACPQRSWRSSRPKSFLML